MPIQQALTASIEIVITQALGLASNAEALMLPLEGKTCIVHLQELDELPPLVSTFAMHFSPQTVDVTLAQPVAEEDSESLDENTCYVSLSLNALPELQKTSHLTKLIKQGKLDFYGDLSILQSLSKLFSELDIDVAEEISKYIGDAPTFWLMNSAKSLKTFAQRQHKAAMKTLSDAALEEKPIAVRPIMLMNFIDEIKALQASTDRLEARIELLENKK